MTSLRGQTQRAPAVFTLSQNIVATVTAHCAAEIEKEEGSAVPSLLFFCCSKLCADIHFT